MRVLMISKACVVGPYQRKLEEMARLPEVELTVIVPHSWKDVQGELELERAHVNGYRLLADPIRFNGNYHLHYYPQLKRRLAEIRPDLVHIDEEPYNLATWHAWRLTRQMGAKSLFFSWQNLVRRYPVPFRLMEHQVLKGVDYAIAGSQGAAEVWREKGYTGRLAIIPQFGVDPELYTPNRQQDSDRGFLIGYAGRLVPEKGVDLLIRAVAGLPGSWQLAIAGDGPEKDALVNLSKRSSVQDQVFFDGQIPFGQVPAFLGVAVVGSDSGEIPYVIGDAGLTFPEDDVEALLAQLLELMQDLENRIELGKKGRQRVLDHFTQEQIAAQTVQVYREILA